MFKIFLYILCFLLSTSSISFASFWLYDSNIDEFSDNIVSSTTNIVFDSGNPPLAKAGKIIISCKDNKFTITLSNDDPLKKGDRWDDTHVDWIIDNEKGSNDSWIVKSLDTAYISDKKAISFAKKLSNAKNIIKLRLNGYKPEDTGLYKFSIDQDGTIKKVLRDCNIK